jgi:hypothetical protein
MCVGSFGSKIAQRVSSSPSREAYRLPAKAPAPSRLHEHVAAQLLGQMPGRASSDVARIQSEVQQTLGEMVAKMRKGVRNTRSGRSAARSGGVTRRPGTPELQQSPPVPFGAGGRRAACEPASGHPTAG